MAFVALEDKTGEGEIILFPSIYESAGENLVQDAVIKVSGKVSSTDKEGNQLSDPKILADEVIFVTNEELDTYQSTGKKMKSPKAKKQPATPTTPPSPRYTYRPIDDRAQTIYIKVIDPADQDKLLMLKKTFNDFPGDSEIILVLGEAKDSAIRLPFKASIDEQLTERVEAIYGPDTIKYK